MTKNVLYYGDNLDILRRYIKDETIGPLKLALNRELRMRQRSFLRALGLSAAGAGTGVWREPLAKQLVSR